MCENAHIRDLLKMHVFLFKNQHGEELLSYVRRNLSRVCAYAVILVWQTSHLVAALLILGVK